MNLKQKKKQIIALALAGLMVAGAIVPVATVLSPSVSAVQETRASETGTIKDKYGNELEYKQTSSVSMSIVGANTVNSKVEIPETINGVKVRYIGTSAFRDNTEIEYVTFPEGLITIGHYAFAGCTNLKEAWIPDSCVNLSPYAFSVCNGLKKVRLAKDTILGAGSTGTTSSINGSPFSFGVYTDGIQTTVKPMEGVEINLGGEVRDYYYGSKEHKKINDSEDLARWTRFDLDSCVVKTNVPYSKNTSTTPENPTTPTNPEKPTNPTTPEKPTNPTTPQATKGSIMLDTANYILAPGNKYTIGAFIKDNNGKSLTPAEIKQLVDSGKLKVRDSRTGSIVDLEQLSTGHFRVTGKNVGTCYILYEIGGTHASVRIDVQNGVKQHGTAVRNTSIFTKDVF